MAQSALREYGQREFSVAERKELQQLLEAKIPGDHISTRTGAGGGTSLRAIFWRRCYLEAKIAGEKGPNNIGGPSPNHGRICSYGGVNAMEDRLNTGF